MNRLTRVLFIVLALTVSAGATIPRDPDFTFRWNRFTSVITVDSFLIAAGRDGLMVFQRSADLSLAEKSPVFTTSIPIVQRRFGSVLAVQTITNGVAFYDLSTLPNLTLLGEIDLGVAFKDFALRGNDLYVARGFDGLFRYRLTGYNSAQLVDSSLLGIHYLGVQISGDSLLALDDYNGILFYHLDGSGSATFQEYLYLPFQASSFLKQDSLLIMALYTNEAYVARLRPTGAIITDSFSLMINPRRIMANGQTILLVDSSDALVETLDPVAGKRGLAQLEILPDPSLEGSITRAGSKAYLTLPLRDGGIGYYDIDSLWSYSARPIFGLTQQGRVTSLQMVNGKMFIGADKSPVDEYHLGTNGAPIYERTLYSALDNVTGIDVSGDSIFVSYPQIRRSVVLQVTPDSNTYRGAFYLDTMLYRSLRFNARKIDTLRSAFTVGESQVGMYTISDSGEVSAAGFFNVIGRILDIQIVDSIAAVSTGKGIWLFRIYDDFTTEYRATIEVDAAPYELFRYGNELATFTGSTLLRFNVTDPSRVTVDTLLHLPWGITRATQVGRLLYAVGEEGICVIDASGSTPVLLDSGGRGGFLIAAADGMVAVSDSNRVHIYNLSQYPTPVDNNRPPLPVGFALNQNYPNPFNPSTTISYNLPARAQVELTVFDLLGREVNTLVDETQGAGQHQVIWNGIDGAGHSVATGVYFYLLKAGNLVASKKMILLK